MPSGRKKVLTDELLINLNNQGMTDRQIADMAGVTRRTVMKRRILIRKTGNTDNTNTVRLNKDSYRTESDRTQILNQEYKEATNQVTTLYGFDDINIKQLKIIIALSNGLLSYIDLHKILNDDFNNSHKDHMRILLNDLVRKGYVTKLNRVTKGKHKHRPQRLLYTLTPEAMDKLCNTQQIQKKELV